MFRVLPSVILFFLSFLLWGQQPTEETAELLANSTDYVSEDFDAEEIQEFINKKKIGFQMEVGTSFGTAFGGGNFMTTYVAPHISYRVSPKFSINAGAIIAQGMGSFYSETKPYGLYGYSTPMYPRSFVYIEGDYKVSDRLTLTGTAYKEIDVFNQNPNSSTNFDTDINGVIMGVDYKIRENIYIRGEIELSNGRNPYRHPGMDPWRSPFNSFNDPF